MAVHTPLQSSGAISLSDVQTEFGGSNPVSMSEYYRDASYANHDGSGVSDLVVNDDIPNSGQIGMSEFYGTVGSVTITIPSSTTHYNLRNVLTASPYSWDGSSPIAVHLIIPSTVQLSSLNTNTAALTCNLASNCMLSILNNGVILGRHGIGGQGGVINQGIHPAHYHGKNGYPGGAAIVLQNIGRGVLITNNNTIGGGGGGGGGGGACFNNGQFEDPNDAEAGCQGGTNHSGRTGGQGQSTNAATGPFVQAPRGTGGAGGALGSSGSNGGGATCSASSPCTVHNGNGGAGAAGGKAIAHLSGVGSQTINGTATHSYNGTNGIGGATS